MANISNSQRQLNIISKALTYEFEINGRLEFEDVVALAEEHLIEAVRDEGDERYEECEITTHGSTQGASWSDNMGFEFRVDGELISANDYSRAANYGENRIVFHWVVDSLGDVVGLYQDISNR